MCKALCVVSVVVASIIGACAQQSDTALRKSIDVKLAPRSLLLTGGDVDSKTGSYIIEFPSPNDCVILGPVKAQSRSFALYRAVSEGGFTLKPGDGGLTVWTIEEWE